MASGKSLGAVAVAVGVGAAAAAGVLAERATRGGVREPGRVPEGYEYTPGLETVTIADDGIPLHVEIDDPEVPDPDKPTIVFSHGYCLSMRSWVLQRRALALAGYRLVLWDQRSHGRSGPSDPEHCTIDQLGRDLKRVIEDHASSGPLMLVGHSMGGMTIMSLTDQFPEVITDRVQSVAFVATSGGGTAMVSLGFGPMVGGLIGRVGPGLLGRLARYQEPLTRLRTFGRGFEDALVAKFSFGSPMSTEAVQFAGDILFGTPFSVMGDFLPTLEGHDKRAALAVFDGIETLVLNGEEDLLTPPEHSAEIVRRIPGAEHIVVKDAGHLIMLEHPVVVNDQLLALAGRGERAAAEGIEVARKPRVKRILTDVTRMARRPRKPARTS